jgi:hypothetical protein
VFPGRFSLIPVACGGRVSRNFTCRSRQPYVQTKVPSERGSGPARELRLYAVAASAGRGGGRFPAKVNVPEEANRDLYQSDTSMFTGSDIFLIATSRQDHGNGASFQGFDEFDPNSVTPLLLPTSGFAIGRISEDPR